MDLESFWIHPTMLLNVVALSGDIGGFVIVERRLFELFDICFVIYFSFFDSYS